MPNFDDIDLTDVIMDGDPYGEFEDPGGGGGSDFNPDNLSVSTNTPSDNDVILTKENETWVVKVFSRVWDYIKGKIGISSNGSNSKFLNEKGNFVTVPDTVLGTCTTAAATAAKVVTLTDVTDFELNKGTVIVVKFTNTNTAQNPTLNVNNTGAKSIYYNTSVLTKGSLGAAGTANRYIEYMYDGTNWVWISQGIDYNATYTLADRSMDVYCETAAATAAKVGTAYYYSLKNNSKFHIRFRYANSAQSKLTLNVGDRGARNLWINGVISSSTNYTLPAGEYECVYYNNAYYLRTDSPYAFIPSHIGQIVESTMLASEDDCKKLYGFNTSWIQHSGYMLRGATSGVTADHTGNDGGADSVTVSSVASHNHTQNEHSHGAYMEFGATANTSYSIYDSRSGWYNQWGQYFKDNKVSNTTATNIANGSNYTVNTLPKYKNVYIWERVS